jgi:hypothetical protein
MQYSIMVQVTRNFSTYRQQLSIIIGPGLGRISIFEGVVDASH